MPVSGPSTLGDLVPGVAWAEVQGGYRWWVGPPMGWAWGAWGIGMSLMMLLFWGLLIAAVVVA